MCLTFVRLPFDRVLPETFRPGEGMLFFLAIAGFRLVWLARRMPYAVLTDERSPGLGQ